MKIATKTGDDGKSFLATGKRLKKNHPFFQALGDLDSLQATIGWAKVAIIKEKNNVKILPAIEKILDDLYFLMGFIGNEMKTGKYISRKFDEREVVFLENEIEKIEKNEKMKEKFVRPGKNEISARLHLTRTACRQAERSMVALTEIVALPLETLKYLNRLSDLLFLWAN